MCGIAGWFSPSPAIDKNKQNLQAMGDSIAHRGPDGQGFACIGHARFAHRRLAILDLDNGHQPMFDHKHRTCIVYNGEIYNFRNLRRQLVERGAVFNTHCDTEVILQLYLHEGIQGFQQLLGMYAFALWDERQQTGYLVRDPLGIKPLFYQRTGDGELIFGSEAKAILARDNKRGELNESQLHFVMNFRYIPGNESLFNDISQLPPGAIMRWQTDGAIDDSQRIAEPGNSNTGESSSCDSPSQKNPVLQALRGSVQRHLVSDVEVGAYLSGGIDSAAVVALANELNPGSIRTFTVDAGDEPMEARHAKRTAELLGVDNLQQALCIDARQELAQLIWHLEVPKVNALQVMKVAQHTSQYVKVALSGIGSDELFLGYNIHSIVRHLHRTSAVVPAALINASGTLMQFGVNAIGRIPWSEPWRLTELLRQLPNWSHAYGLIRNIWDSPDMRQKIYGPRMLDCPLTPINHWLEEHWPNQRDPVLAIREFEWRHKMVNDLLWQEDRCGMAMGLEVRVPFVDLEFKKSVWHYNREKLMMGGKNKGLLKHSIRSLLPGEILKRPKSGFQVNAASFFETQLSALAEEYLSADYTQRVGLFNPIFIAQVRNLPKMKATRWHYFMLYLILGVHLWVEIYERGNRTLA